MTITFRKDKNYPLTYPEMDENFRDLLEDTDLQRVTENGAEANIGFSANNVVVSDTVIRYGADYYTDTFSISELRSDNDTIELVDDKIRGTQQGQIAANGSVIQTVYTNINDTTQKLNSSQILIESFNTSITQKNFSSRYKSKIKVEIDLRYEPSNFDLSFPYVIIVTRNGKEVYRSAQKIIHTTNINNSPPIVPPVYNEKILFDDFINQRTEQCDYKLYFKFEFNGASDNIFTNQDLMTDISVSTRTYDDIEYGENVHFIRAGKLYGWGNNEFGQLGTDDTIYRSLPTQIGTDTNWEKIDTNGMASFGLKTDGTIWVWGATGVVSGNVSSPVQVGTETDWHIIEMTKRPFQFADKEKNSFFCIRESDGKLFSFGSNLNGILGTNDTVDRSLPTQIGLTTSTDWCRQIEAINGTGLFGHTPAAVVTIWSRNTTNVPNNSNSNLYYSAWDGLFTVYAWGNNRNSKFYPYVSSIWPIDGYKSSPTSVGSGFVDTSLFQLNSYVSNPDGAGSFRLSRHNKSYCISNNYNLFLRKARRFDLYNIPYGYYMEPHFQGENTNEQVIAYTNRQQSYWDADFLGTDTNAYSSPVNIGSHWFITDFDDYFGVDVDIGEAVHKIEDATVGFLSIHSTLANSFVLSENNHLYPLGSPGNIQFECTGRGLSEENYSVFQNTKKVSFDEFFMNEKIEKVECNSQQLEVLILTNLGNIYGFGHFNKHLWKDVYELSSGKTWPQTLNGEILEDEEYPKFNKPELILSRFTSVNADEPSITFKHSSITLMETVY